MSSAAAGGGGWSSYSAPIGNAASTPLAPLVDDTVVRHIPDLRLKEHTKLREKLRLDMYNHCFRNSVPSEDEFQVVGEETTEAWLLYASKQLDKPLAAFIVYDAPLKVLEESRIGRYITWVCTFDSVNRRKGYMRKLMSNALQHWRSLKADDARDVTLYVDGDNAKAIGLYHSLGFNTLGVMHLEATSVQDVHPAFVMYQPLRAISLRHIYHEEPSKTMSKELRAVVRGIILENHLGGRIHAFAMDEASLPFRGPVHLLLATDAHGVEIASVCYVEVQQHCPRIFAAANPIFIKRTGLWAQYFVQQLLNAVTDDLKSIDTTQSSEATSPNSAAAAAAAKKAEATKAQQNLRLGVTIGPMQFNVLNALGMANFQILTPDQTPANLRVDTKLVRMMG